MKALSVISRTSKCAGKFQVSRMAIMSPGKRPSCRLRAERFTATCNPRATAGPLSSRERESADLVAQGLSNREIADRLVISNRTVERHLTNICSKIDVETRTKLALWSHAHGVGSNS